MYISTHKLLLNSCVVLLSCSLQFIQAQDATPQWTPGALPMASSLTFAAAFPVVENEPYSANVFTQEIQRKTDGSVLIHESHNIYMRDSAGRIRDEQIASPVSTEGGFTKASVHVLDPVAMQDIRWDAAAKTYTAFPIPDSFRSYRQEPILDCAKQIARQKNRSTTSNNDTEQALYTDLGERAIEGIRIRGCHIDRALSAIQGTKEPRRMTSEIWTSPELRINLLFIEKISDGTERLTRLTNIDIREPDPQLFRPPAGYTDIAKTPSPGPQNTNPNYAKIREYGHIEWHGSTATLIAGSSRPLDMAAQLLSTCLDVSVSAEDPQYLYPGDLLDVTAPQWAAQHPDKHAYAAKPGRLEISFPVNLNGLPLDLFGVLQDIAKEANQQQPYTFEVRRDLNHGHTFYSFVPTRTHDEHGNPIGPMPYLDQKISLQAQNTPVFRLASDLSNKLTELTGYHFSCCHSLILGRIWGSDPMSYRADELPARQILEDLMSAVNPYESYVLRCEPMDKRFCFINVHGNAPRIPATAPQSGRCSASGYAQE